VTFNWGKELFRKAVGQLWGGGGDLMSGMRTGGY